MSLPPIRRQIVVPAAADLAFAVFTSEIECSSRPARSRLPGRA
jgi:hypothetical protein